MPKKLALVAIAGAMLTSAQNQYPFQNPSLGIEERVDNILSLMTLEESWHVSIPIPAYRVWHPERWKFGGTAWSRPKSAGQRGRHSHYIFRAGYRDVRNVGSSAH